MGRVHTSHREAATAAIDPLFFIVQQIIWELHSFFPVGSSVKVHLYVY